MIEGMIVEEIGACDTFPGQHRVLLRSQKENINTDFKMTVESPGALADQD